MGYFLDPAFAWLGVGSRVSLDGLVLWVGWVTVFPYFSIIVLSVKPPSRQLDEILVGGDWNINFVVPSIGNGKIIPTDFHMFQRGRPNHQPGSTRIIVVKPEMVSLVIQHSSGGIQHASPVFSKAAWDHLGPLAPWVEPRKSQFEDVWWYDTV